MRKAFIAGWVVLVWAAVCVAASCPKCKRAVGDGQKFCGNCGTAVSAAVTCTKCKKPIPAGQKFCGACGTPVTAAPKPKPKPKPKPAPKIVKYAGPSSEWDDQAVDRAIAKAVKYLWSRQRGDGSWASYGSYPTGATSAAVYALLASGAKASDPKMVKALDWLAKHNTNKVYCLGLRCNAWLMAYRQAGGKYGGYLDRDGVKLIRSINRTSGGWHYDTTESKGNYHNSTSQYGVLGAWALARATGEVPSAFWSRVNLYWNRGQLSDGGWGYSQTKQSTGGKNAANLASVGSMSAAGLASLFVCYDATSVYGSLECRGDKTPPAIARGLAWFDKYFGATLTGKKKACAHVAMDAYYLYGVERVGLASGYKYFGANDWFQMGARHLIKLQQPNGATGRKIGGDHGKYGIISETSFAIIFWVRGRYPVIMNKLEFTGDWNNRPRDLANLTRWFEVRTELPVAWQIVSLNSDPWKWLDSPIMYISGAKAPQFTDEQLGKLREYVRRGGTIFSVTECQGAAFSKAMREIYKKLFPDYSLAPCLAGHDIYSEKVLARLKVQAGYFELSNGIRPLAIHVESDLPRAWQSYAVATRKDAFAGAANIVGYLAGATTNLRPRNTIPWPKAKTFKSTGTVTLTRVRYKGNCDPEPLSLHRMALLAGPETGITVNVMPPTAIKDLPQSGAKIAAMTGTTFVYLTGEEVAALKQFIAGGGLLVVDAAGGSKRFADAALSALEKVFGSDARTSTSPLLRIKGFALDKAYYRRKTVLQTNMTSHEFRLTALSIDGGKRIGALFSRDDLTGGLIGVEAFSVDGYASKTAYRIMRNAILYAAGRR